MNGFKGVDRGVEVEEPDDRFPTLDVQPLRLPTLTIEPYVVWPFA
jgi:hypothetical protein